MFHHIVSVSSVCLLLAFAGWDTEETKGFREDIFDPAIFEGYNRKHDISNGVWTWPFRLLSDDPEPCRRCGIFHGFGGSPGYRDDLGDLGIIPWIFYKVVYTIEDLGAVVDGLVLGNAILLLLSTGVHLTLYTLHSKGWRGLIATKVEMKDAVCQKNSSVWRKLKQLKERHRAELEEMARTIEFLQQERHKQQKHLEQKDVEVDTLQTAIRHLYHAHAEGDVEIVPAFHPEQEFTEPDLEWDDK